MSKMHKKDLFLLIPAVFHDPASKSYYLLLRVQLGRSVNNETFQNARGSGRGLIVTLHVSVIKIRKFPSNTTGLLYIIDWLHVLTLWGYHQAFTMNHLVKKLRTFLGFQTMFTNLTVRHPRCVYNKLDWSVYSQTSGHDEHEQFGLRTNFPNTERLG